MPVDVTALLKEWGVTIGLLSVAATALLVIFAISFREFASWFVKINQVLKNQDEILELLKRTDGLPKTTTNQVVSIESKTLPPLPSTVTSKERFQIHS